MPPQPETALLPSSYLDLLRDQGAALVEAVDAAGPQAPVPSCPGWTTADLLRHTGEVVAHKAAILRLGHPPEVRPGLTAADGPELVAACTAALDDLVGLLERLGPEQPTWTWSPGWDTTWFWHRRMAHEAVVHRVDADLALAGGTGAAGTLLTAEEAADRVREDIALDGIDEVLTWFTGDPRVLSQPSARDGQVGRVLVVAPQRWWAVDLADGATEVQTSAGGDVPAGDVRVDGAPAELHLGLWGRVPDLTWTPLTDRAASVRARLDARFALALQ